MRVDEVTVETLAGETVTVKLQVVGVAKTSQPAAAPEPEPDPVVEPEE
jgi:hypothetical protein